jgi:DNA-directed RNA polymerase specialized sigma24 family protein
MNQKEFEAIVMSARQTALNVCHSYGMDEDQSEDIAQDTMLKLWTIHQELPVGKPVEGLAAVVSRHLVIDLLRQQRKTVPIDTQQLIADTHILPDARAEIADNEDSRQRGMAGEANAVVALDRISGAPPEASRGKRQR